MLNQTAAQSLEFLKLLAHDIRWQLLAALAESDRRVQELVERLQRPQNLLSYHLRLLREGEIIQERRSSADGRDVYYSLNLSQLRHLYQASGQALHPALTGGVLGDREMGGERPLRILFLCTHNSARSQLAEGITRAYYGGRVEAYSAGSEPAVVHPLAVRAAASFNIDISGQHAKHLDEFAGQTFDLIITVCDKVREICPTFPGDPQQIHWSLPDPAAVTGPGEATFQAFLQTAENLTTRISYLHLMSES
jgi:ArsR family transcriptional regulator, arsenate/arsenite/antimonite-responsive transcriptional repressor / arsenate reductase (thioredoxin)